MSVFVCWKEHGGCGYLGQSKDEESCKCPTCGDKFVSTLTLEKCEYMLADEQKEEAKKLIKEELEENSKR